MLAPKRQAVQRGAKLAIENRIQLIYFGAWLLELFPTNPRGVCQCFLRNVSLAQNGHIQINKPGLEIKVLVSGVSCDILRPDQRTGWEMWEINVEIHLNQVVKLFL